MSLKKIWNNQIYRSYLYFFLKDFAFFSAVLVPFFTDWGHISLFQIQLIQSWFSLWVFILEVPTGAVADKIGRKYSLALGSLIVAIAVLIYGSIPRFEVFLLAEFIFALGYALTSGADQALLFDTLKEGGREKESTKILGRADSIHMLGMLIASLFGGVIAAKYGINAPMLASSVPLIIASAIGWSIREPRIHSDSESPKYLDILKKGLVTIRKNNIVRTLAIDSIVVSSVSYFVIWFNQPLLKSIGVPITYFGFAHSFLLLSEIVISSNFSFMEKILGVGKKYLQSSALLVTFGLVFVAISPSILSIIIFIVLVGGVGYTRGTYIVGIANKSIDSGSRATVLSTIGMFRRFSLVLLNPIIGYIASRSLTVALIILSLLPLLTFLINAKSPMKQYKKSGS